MMKQLLTRIPAAILGVKLKTIMYGIAAAAIAAVLYFAVVKPRMALRSAEKQIETVKVERDAAAAAAHAYKVDNEANKLIAIGTAKVATVNADARQEAAVKAEVREVQTTIVRDRIVERAAKSDDTVSDSTDAFLDDLGGSK